MSYTLDSRLSLAFQNALANAFRTQVGATGGFLKVYDQPRPADPGVALTGQTLLATFGVTIGAASGGQCAITFGSATALAGVAGTGTVSCTAGAALFQNSQSGILTSPRSIVIVAGVAYQLTDLSGGTTGTLGGAPTFGASAFTYVTPWATYTDSGGTRVLDVSVGLTAFYNIQVPSNAFTGATITPTAAVFAAPSTAA